MVEALVGASPSDELLECLERGVHAPALLDVEVTSLLRGLELERVLTPTQAARALDNYWALTIQRHSAEPFRERVWALRHQFTSCDAHYIALAEALDARLLTCDRKLASPGHAAKVKLPGPSDSH